ncbi:MAG: TonB-dependent receptor [Bacteroidetes bacterium]|nr:TonB-dependent receptor [Bacteroidota bacterium]
MKLKFIIITILLIHAIATFAQNISGVVYEINDKKEKNPLIGINVYWMGTNIGTTTNSEGKFQLSKSGITDYHLVLKMLSFKTDTLFIKNNVTRIEHQMKPESQTLQTFELKERNDSYISKLNARNVQVITTGELYKAACCNLSESFETNASVDVSYSDAITGARQIQLLGLSGIYSQIQTENIPSVRGMASTFGLNYIPGSWMESIQIAKGTSSVINGFESITGQINVEYKKPANSEKLFVNIYANNKARIETNVTSAFKLTDKLSTMLMLHTDNFNQKIDKNNDNFMDLPKLNTINIFNRWDYMNPGKFTSRFGIKYMEEHREGGTMDYDKNSFIIDTAKINKWTEPYGFSLTTRRGEVFWKNGIIFPRPYTSLALIVNATNHEQKGYFGINNYYGRERTFYANLLFSSFIINKDHKFTSGLSYILDNFVENYDQTQFVYNYQFFGNSDLFTVHNSVDYKYLLNREESIPGAFLEYTFTHKDKLAIIAGIRADHHNKYGMFYTPRLNIRYHFNELTVIRGSIGYGYRTANLISENLSLLASQRSFVFANDLKQEKALNFGVNFTKSFSLFGRNAEFDVDLYRTNFENQVIVDLERIPTVVYFYNLDGKSYSNSYQVQLSMEPLKSLTLLVAYRINDVKTTIDGVLLERPFVNKYKGLITLSYATRFDKWKFDFTTQFNGSARLPNQSLMPAKIKRADTTPEYVIFNAQITRKFKHFDVYLGGENLGNFTQTDPITEPFAPYHSHFDTTMTWGPVSGTTIYAGLRYTLK